MAATTTFYGSGTDLSNAKNTYGNNPNYSFVDTSASGFDPSSMKSGSYMLGGSGVNTNVSDSLLNSKGITRLGGSNAAGTATALANTLGTKFIYGSGNDLNNARSIYGNNPNYKLVDVSSSNFNPNTMVAGSIMLGGNGVNTNVTDSMLNNANVTRLAGTNSQDTADKLQQNHVNSLMPTATPSYNQFNFSGTLQDYLDQAQTLLQPQLDLQKQNINDNYDNNYIPAANNDTLSRGLARSSYAGNRVDQLNTARDKELSQAVIQNLQNANNLALQNYNTAYDRAYQLNKDQNDYNEQNFSNNMNLYNTANSNYWQNKNYNADQAAAAQTQNNWQTQFDYQKSRDAVSDDQWQKTFDRQGLWHNESSSGGSGGSGGSRRSSGRSSGSSGRKSSGSSSSAKTDYSDDVATLKKMGYDSSFIKASLPTWDYEALYDGVDTPIYGGGR